MPHGYEFFYGKTTMPDGQRLWEEYMVDKAKIEEAIRLYLEGIGEDVNREGLLDTPNRIARMCEEIYGGMDEDPGVHLAKQFSVTSNEMVIEKDITFYSMCEHHLMPFYGIAHIAYIPQGKVVGLSKLARTVEVFARRAQIQEKLTAQIADALEEHLNPAGVMIMLEAEHMCMTMRGVKKPGSKTVTLVARGVFKEDQSLQNQFLSMVR
jgi:GTP cyclohydrolase I